MLRLDGPSAGSSINIWHGLQEAVTRFYNFLMMLLKKKMTHEQSSVVSEQANDEQLLDVSLKRLSKSPTCVH